MLQNRTDYVNKNCNTQCMHLHLGIQNLQLKVVNPAQNAHAYIHLYIHTSIDLVYVIICALTY